MKILIKCCKWMQIAGSDFQYQACEWVFIGFPGTSACIWLNDLRLPAAPPCVLLGILRCGSNFSSAAYFQGVIKRTWHQAAVFWSYPFGVSIAWYQDIPRHCWLDVLYGDSQTPWRWRPVRIGVLWILSWRNRTDWKLEEDHFDGRSRGSKARDSVGLQLNWHEDLESWSTRIRNGISFEPPRGVMIFMLQDLLDLGTSLKYEV